MTIKWPLYDFYWLSKAMKSDGNQGNYALMAIANSLTGYMTFCDCSMTRAWLSVTCMTNVKCVILLSVTVASCQNFQPISIRDSIPHYRIEWWPPIKLMSGHSSVYLANTNNLYVPSLKWASSIRENGH